MNQLLKMIGFGSLEDLKKNPAQLLGMLKSFGIDLKEMIPKFLPVIKEKLAEGVKTLEAKAGAPLLFMGELIPGTDVVAITMYKKAENGTLEIWQSHTSQEGENLILNFLPNVEQLSTTTDTDNTSGNAAIGPGASEPGTDNTAGTV